MQAIKKVGVVGLGTLGTQIAIQAAAYGYEVSAFDPDGEAFGRMQVKVRSAMQMVRRGPTFPVSQWETHARKVRVCDDLARAVGDVDLVIEVVPEDLEAKRRVSPNSTVWHPAMHSWQPTVPRSRSPASRA